MSRQLQDSGSPDPSEVTVEPLGMEGEKGCELVELLADYCIMSPLLLP